jgi:hypothetical protein
VSDDQDWRLEAQLDVADKRGGTARLLGRLRGPDFVHDVEAAVPHDVVITHDENLLFAYASGEATITAARAAIETALKTDGVGASIRISHWDDERDIWRQTDPPPSAEEQQVQAAAERDDDVIETRTLVASAGKMIRAEFEQSMLAWAEQLGLQCSIIEHPHLLTTQVGFTVTGPKGKIDEFSRGLTADEQTTIRTETEVMASAL